MIPAAMLAHRIMGIMAHWREYMGMDLRGTRYSVDFYTDNFSDTRKAFSTDAYLYGKYNGFNKSYRQNMMVKWCWPKNECKFVS
jgi:hypothetical protein